jgi:hypothetical protein
LLLLDGEFTSLYFYNLGILSTAPSFPFLLGLRSVFGLGLVVDHGCTASSARFRSFRTSGILPMAFPLFLLHASSGQLFFLTKLTKISRLIGGCCTLWGCPIDKCIA